MDFLAWRRAQAFSQELMVTTYWSDGLTEKKQRLRSFGATFSGVVWMILSCTSLRKLRVLHSVRSTAAQPCPSRPLSARLCPCAPLRARIVANTAETMHAALCINVNGLSMHRQVPSVPPQCCD